MFHKEKLVRVMLLSIVQSGSADNQLSEWRRVVDIYVSKYGRGKTYEPLSDNEFMTQGDWLNYKEITPSWDIICEDGVAISVYINLGYLQARLYISYEHPDYAVYLDELSDSERDKF